MRGLKIPSFSTLFGHTVQPRHGSFLEHRLASLIRAGALPIRLRGPGVLCPAPSSALRPLHAVRPHAGRGWVGRDAGHRSGLLAAAFLGHVDHARLPALTSAADVLTEAIACGTPVAATRRTAAEHLQAIRDTLAA